MYCPQCRTQTLAPRSLKSVTVDACPQCQGVWFESRELEKAVDVAARNLSVPDEATVTGRLCPECRKHLHQFYYPQTYCTVDMCGSCRGLWLDHNELTEIRVVRNSLREKGEIETVAPPGGFKGKLIDWIDSAIGSLKDFS